MYKNSPPTQFFEKESEENLQILLKKVIKSEEV